MSTIGQNLSSRHARVLRLAGRIRAIAARYGYRNVRLFGSVARDQDGPDSDVDLLVTGHRSLLDLIGLTQDLEQLLDAKVDVVPDHAMKPRVAATALPQAVAL